MPQRVAMPAMLRQLLRISKRTGVRLDKVTPQPATTLQGYEVVPMDVVVAGRYLPVQRFLHRLRVQARVAGDGVHASGRLFSVDTLNLAADEQLPRLTATIRVNGFVYNDQAPAPRHLRRPTPRTQSVLQEGCPNECHGGTPWGPPRRGPQRRRAAEEDHSRQPDRPLRGADGIPAAEAAEGLGVLGDRSGAGLGGPGYGRRRLCHCGRLGTRALIGARSGHQADVRQGSVRAAHPRERGDGVRGTRYF